MPLRMSFVCNGETLQEVAERNKKIQQDKKVAYDMKVAEVTWLMPTEKPGDDPFLFLNLA